MAAAALNVHRQDWLLLVLLSVLWGGSFFFTGVAVRELPPLTVVLARVALGAAVLAPVMWFSGTRFPTRAADWTAFLVMALFNNVIPFSLIAFGQTMIASGLASVLNATTPLFTVLVMAVAGEEALTRRRLVGAVIGLAGVVILRGQPLQVSSGQTIGILLCLGAALSYGLSAMWGRRKLAGVPPLAAASCQLVCATPVMLLLAALVEWPHGLPVPGWATWGALLATATLSTALAYIVFFQILRRSGASNVMLVTLLIPVTAILLGHVVLGETLKGREIAGALVIASALLVMDGRVLVWTRKRARD